MLFLLNDRVLSFQAQDFAPPLAAGRFDALSLAYVIKLGQEMFADNPLLHRSDPERATRLAMLILDKAPNVNAALFVAAAGCRPDQVISRLADVGGEVIVNLYNKELTGQLNPVLADREVWRRLAA